MDDSGYWTVQPKIIPAVTQNGRNRNRNIPYNDSGDSIASVVIPPRALCLTRNNLPFVVDQYRNVESHDFFLCLCSIILLVGGIGLIGASTWTLVTRIPYVYISEHVSYLGIVSFTICAGLLSFPSSWLAWVAHSRKTGYIPLLAVFICVSIIMLATGTALGTVHRSRITFDWFTNNNTYKSFIIQNLTIYEGSGRMNIFPRLQAGSYRSALNSSMIASLYSYDGSSTIRYGWDSIQQKFRCCGVNSSHDWHAVRKEIPETCCKKFYIYNTNNNKTELYNKCATENVYLDGCLDAVAYDLAHQSALLTSVGYIVLFLELITLILCTVIYVRIRATVSEFPPSRSRLSYCYSYSVTPRHSSYVYQSRQPTMETNTISPSQAYYPFIQPPSNQRLQQLQQQQLQQSNTSVVPAAINTDVNTKIKDNNYELMDVPN